MIFLVLFVSLLAVAPADQDGGEFEPNNLFVTSEGSNRVYEFDSKGHFVRFFGATAGLDSPQGLAFGPDGLLYVVSRGSSSIFVFNPDALLLFEIPVAGGAAALTALAFGPDGLLFVLDPVTALIHVLTDEATEVLTVTLPPGDYAQSDLLFGAEGDLYLSDTTGGRVVQVDVRGAEVRVIGAGQLSSPVGLAFGGEGNLIVSDGSVAHMFAGENLIVGSFGGSSGLTSARDVAVGPNGNSYVADANGNIFEFNRFGLKVRDFSAFGMENPFAMAFAPMRFFVQIKGKMARSGLDVIKIQEKSAIITVSPGSRTMMLTVTDDVTTFDDLASVFGAKTLVFHGFEGMEDVSSKRRLCHGSQVSLESYEMGVASIAIWMKGGIDKQGRFFPKGAKGTLHRASGTAVYSADIKFGKQLQ